MTPDIASTCCGCILTTLRFAEDYCAQNHRAKDGDRLVCSGCGKGYVGTDAEVAQVEAADAAYVRKEGGTW